ncbi:30S ribosomal protein S3 [Puniceicoccales bacterium CK1056]|uniref:Small ribosomal subunit protein uS3 n=1 Tax=Oceanipulchritudo coccoides TaxID=2706888 RepID=A0A6B2M367_9BACT|nr:30S ribosomal protein S3 [Oceanipulchritudo coccoides]NDV62649.1 30S ribosomal protein S3 [Oceanipulchritudo coccoides]
MGQKVNPIGFRLSVRRDWQSRWFSNKKEFGANLKEDYEIRSFLEEKFRYAAVPRIMIERAGNRVRIKVYTARPGIVIGRKGAELEKIKESLGKLIKKDVILDIQEVKKPDMVAKLVAESVALQLERRISFRRAMKKAVQSTMSIGAKGIRLQVSGRLGGADIARTESARSGSVPLHTLRANIDYGFSEARTVYGKIGVKCWICLDDEEKLFN